MPSQRHGTHRPLDVSGQSAPETGGRRTVSASTLEIFDFNARGTVLAVRPCCHTDPSRQVWFDTERAIVARPGATGFPPPFVVAPEEIVQHRP